MRELPAAIYRIWFSQEEDSRPTGAQILAMAQQTFGNGGKHHELAWMYDTGRAYSPGQSSEVITDHCRLVPSLDAPFIRLRSRYREIMLVSYVWPGWHLSSHTPEEGEAAVKELGETLSRNLYSALRTGSCPTMFNPQITRRNPPRGVPDDVLGRPASRDGVPALEYPTGDHIRLRG